MERILSLVDEGVELRALVATLDGSVLADLAVSGPSNPRFIGPAALRARLDAVVADALAGSGGGSDVAPVVAVGASLSANPEHILAILADAVPIEHERIVLLPIERCALAGSLGLVELRRAVVVRADLGSRAWGVGEPGCEAARGGFGEVLGDDGSAYWIGRRGIRAAIKAHEKRVRNTQLRGRLVQHFGLDGVDRLRLAEHEACSLDRYAIAGFLTQVLAAAGEGDAVALEILDEAGRDLAVMALSLIHELDLGHDPFAVLPAGSVLVRRGMALEAFMKALKNKTSKANLVQTGMGATAGALLLAIQHLGEKVQPDTVEALRASVKARVHA